MSQTQPIRFDDRGAFHAWAGQQPERWERHEGIVVAVAPERAVHARIKARVWQALEAVLAGSGLPCEVFPDGMTVEVDGGSDYEPDVVVSCGDRVDNQATVVATPVVVVEVLSPSTAQRDNLNKLDG